MELKYLMEKNGNNMELKKKNRINSALIIIIIMLIVSCNKNSQLEIYKVPPMQYEFDKNSIAETYLKNIEYYRLHYPYDLELKLKFAGRVLKDSIKERLIKEQIERHFQQYPKVKHDPANFYEPHACRFSTSMDIVRSPIPTKEQVFVSTDSIIYNKDASLCIAFLCVEENFSDIDGLEKSEHAFYAEAMVGYRKHPKDTLKTYPLSFFSLMGYDKKKTLVADLIRLYTTKLKGSFLSGSVYGDHRFNHNVGEKGFFKESPLFMKYNDSTYYFQMYRALGEDYMYDYPY